MMDLIGYKLTTSTHTMREENSSLSKASHHFTVVRASGAKKKMSLPRLSTVAMFSLATEVEEPKIEALTPCFFSMYT